ncbi:glycosyltransferase family 4 protein [Xylanibacter caecicola]|uniref:glycosyltransferase family 4 protein n=1 Tax=Xylanibacter caecicola TaxID=2736294 RepID=UPI002585E02A|nr:glycosyltransferase family 4 protein [Xylanibacter caecicola]
MKRVFHIISHFDMGGAERVAVNIAKSGNPDIEYHIVELIRTRSEFTSAFIDELKAAGICYHRAVVPDIRFHYIFERLAAVTFPLRFIFLYLRYRPVAVHSHTEMPDLAVFATSRLFPRLLRRCRLVRTIHNTCLWTGLKKTGRRVERFFISRRANVAISQSVLDNYRREYGERPPMIYNGVGQVPQKRYEGIVPGKKNILFAGRFEPQKGIDTLVEIIAGRRDDTRYHFHVAGDGSMRDVVMKRLSGLDNVTVVPPVYGLSSYLSSFDYMLMPSVFEGLSIMSIEASMAALPVIINNCAGLKDTLPDTWRLKVENNDIAAYDRLFDSVIPSADAHAFGREAQRFVLDNFGIERMRREYERIYLE